MPGGVIGNTGGFGPPIPGSSPGRAASSPRIGQGRLMDERGEGLPVACAVLAAGRGKRLGGGRAKVLREVAGRPMLAWVLDSARQAGAEPVVVVVGYDREAVVASLPEGVKWVVQEEPMGTADAVRRTEGLLGDWPGEVWVLCGDVPGTRPRTLRALRSARRGSDASCAMLTMEVDGENRYGRVIRNGSGAVAGIVEYADATEEERSVTEVNAGTYCFLARDLFGVLPRISADNAQGEYYLTDAVRLLIEDGKKVEALKAPDTCECLGADTLDAIEELDELLDERRRREGEPEWRR